MKDVTCEQCGAHYPVRPDIKRCLKCGGNLKRTRRSHKSKRKILKNRPYYAERRASYFGLGMLAGVIIGFIGLLEIFITRGYMAVGIFAVGILLFQKASDKRKIWKKGVKGERKVARYLNNLPRGFFVFNDVTLPHSKGNLDHVVVGPTGVFAIETKNYLGRFHLNGDDLQIIKKGQLRPLHSNPGRQSRYNARELSKFISAHKITGIRVRPVVTFINKNVDIKRNPQNYDFIFYDALPGFILKQGGNMDYEKVKKIAFSLRKYCAEYSFFE